MSDLPAEGSSVDGSLVWFPLPTMRLRITVHFFMPLPGPVCCVRFSPDGRRLAAACKQKVMIYDTETADILGLMVPRQDAMVAPLVCSLSFSPDGRFLATGSEDRKIRVWELQNQQLARTLSGHTGEVYAVDYAANDDTVVSGSSDGTVKVWAVYSGILLRTLTAPTDVKCVAVSPDSQYVVGGCHDGSIYIWATLSGDHVASFTGHTTDVCCLTFMPTTDVTIVSAGLDKSLKVWKMCPLNRGWKDATRLPCDVAAGTITTLEHLDTHHHHVQTLCGHINAVRTIAVTPDACWILSGSQDCATFVWDAYSGRIQAIAEADADAVLSVATSRHFFATGGADYKLRVWTYNTVSADLSAFTGAIGN